MRTVGLIFNIYQQPAGGMIFATQSTRAVAVELGDTAIVESCDTCLQAARAYYDRDAQWQRTKNAPKARGDGEAIALDPLVDRAVSGLFNHAENLTRSLPPDHDLLVVAREFNRLAFPNGAEGITKLNHPEEAVAVNELLRRFDAGNDLAPFVAKLGLAALVEGLRVLGVKFDAAVRKSTPGETTWDQVKEASADAHERYVQLIALIIGKYNLQTPEHVKARTALMAPILKRDTEVAEALKHRRPVVDVDPATGDPIPAPADPASPTPPVDHG